MNTTHTPDTYRPGDCTCGSGEPKYPLADGYGIFLCYACEACMEARLQRFRPDIMDRYETDEEIYGED